MKNVVDASAKKDIQDASVYDGNYAGLTSVEYTLPKFYLKVQYCVSCAIHAKVVRVRNQDVRRTRISTKRRMTVSLVRKRVGRRKGRTNQTCKKENDEAKE